MLPLSAILVWPYFSVVSVRFLGIKELFQTADGKMAEARMGDEEACLDLKREKMI